MKKYIIWLFVLWCSLFFAWHSNALFCSSNSQCSGTEQCVNGECTVPESNGWSTAPDPCLTKVTSSLWTSTTCDKTPKEDLDDCMKWTNYSNTAYKCATRYSCETLFTDAATANTCNFARCENQRGKWSSYCTCKYWTNGDWKMKWIPLNTSIPFLWNCLQKTTDDPNDTAALNAFPTIVSVATRILVTVIMLAWFIMIIVWGVQWSTWNAAWWKKMITKVAIWFALLWSMWAILRLINPNFFK